MSGPVVITGAGGQLGAALSETFPDALALPRAEWDVSRPAPEGLKPSLVLHAAAWTDVDGAEETEDQAHAINALGTRSVAALGVPVVAYSSDYVFDGTKREPYVESDATNPVSAYGRTKLAGEQEVKNGWVVRTSWLFGATGHNFLRTMLRIGERQDEVAVVDDPGGMPDLRRAPRRGNTRADRASVWHVAPRSAGRVQLGRLRRGDLRREPARVPRAADTNVRDAATGNEASLLGAAERALGSTRDAPLAGGPAGLSRADSRCVAGRAGGRR